MREKRKTLDKKCKNLAFKKIAYKQRLQERGITLIALVVTIIILLILSGVTLNIALSDNGLFSKTKKAAEDYKEAQSEEEESIRQISTQLYSEYVGAKVEGYSPTDNERGVTINGITSGLNNGNKDANGNTIANDNITDDGNQTFKAEEMNWRVWDYDGNTLRIIGDPTTDALTLKGAAGYNNGVWAIEKICKELYSNEEKGAIATNLKRTDIQKVSTYDYTKYKHKDNDSANAEEVTEDTDENVIYFGESKTYKNGKKKYPTMWDKNDKDWTYGYDKEKKSVLGKDKECKKWETIGTKDGQMEGIMNQEDKETTFKQSYYYHIFKESEFINDAYYDLIFKKSDGQTARISWLAGRYVHLSMSDCAFGLQLVVARDDEMSLSGQALYISNRLGKYRHVCTTPHSFY